MFRWYSLSSVCFVYLSDLPPYTQAERVSGNFHDREITLHNCRWFTRGWTLQELIAPHYVEFYDSSWKFFDTKANIRDLLTSITRISRPVLESASNLRSTPVAVKMSWAAYRETKRVEDMAYSLLGIFDINMPMLYGEGDKAFHRLQEEIARETNDLSLFAWRAEDNPGTPGFQPFRGIFANSPAEFGTCDKMRHSPLKLDSTPKEFSLTNRGVRIETVLFRGLRGTHMMDLGLIDPAGWNGHGFTSNISVHLVSTADGFTRCRPWLLEVKDVHHDLRDDGPLSTTYIRKKVSMVESLEIHRSLHKSFHFRLDLPSFFRVDHLDPKPKHLWHESAEAFITGSHPLRGFGATLEVIFSRVDINQRVKYPILLTFGWSSRMKNALVAVHSSERLENTAGRLVRGLVPMGFPDFGNYNTYRTLIDSGLDRIRQTPGFWSRSVEFIEMNGSHEGVAPGTKPLTTFSVELEAEDLGSGCIFYTVVLTGRMSHP